MTGAERTRDEQYAMPWALPDVETEAIVVIDLTDATCTMHRDAHCPACGGRRMQAIVVPEGDRPEGDRYDRCLDCERLWAVHDGSLELVVGAKVRRDER